MALKDILPDWAKPKTIQPKLGLVATTKIPKLTNDPQKNAEVVRQFLRDLSAEIQTNKQKGLTTTIPDSIVSWLGTNSSLNDLQLKSPDLSSYHIGEEIKRLDREIVVNTGEFQASQYQTPQDLKEQIQNSTSTQLDLQRDINKTLPLLREALAGATGTAKQKELSLLVLSNSHYNNILKKILTKELESGVPLTTAISNTLQKARGNPAIATIIAMANTNTQKNIKDPTVDDLLNIDQKTAELVTQKIKDSAPQDLELDRIPQKAKTALDAKFQVGSKQNLEKILISSGKTQEQAAAIINEIITQATQGATPQETSKFITTQHNLGTSKETITIITEYANNVQFSLEKFTHVHPITAKLAALNQGKDVYLQNKILSIGKELPSSPIINYVEVFGTHNTYTNESGSPAPQHDFKESILFLSASDPEVAYFISQTPTLELRSSGDINITPQTTMEGGGVGGGIVKMGAEMFVNAAGNKIKEEAALWVIKAAALASGVSAPFVAAWETARNMPVIGGVIKNLEKNVLQQGWETAKKVAVVGGVVVGGALVGLGILISKGVGFLVSVGGGALAGFMVGGPIGGIFGGIGGGLANFFWPQISGAASSVWGGLGSLLSSAGSGLSSLAQSFFGGLSSLGGTIASGVGWMVGGVVGAVGATTLLTVFTASSTFLTDIAPFGTSEHLTLTKTASHTPSVLENNTGSVDITYTITFKPKNNSQITSVDQVADTFTFVSDSQNLPPLTSPLTPQSFTRNNAGDYVATYNVTINTNSYPDTAIVNTIAAAVTLTTEDNQTVTDSVSANRRVIVGDPPIEFPYCWPTSGVITQAPNTGHLTLNDSGEAVDIGQSDGNMVYASHDGTIFRDNWGCGYGGANGGYGNCFAVVSPAGYSTIYGHFDWQNPEFAQNSQVKMGDLLGIVGSTGNSTGPHLHYELVGISFADLNIGSTNVGTNVIESCSGQN